MGHDHGHSHVPTSGGERHVGRLKLAFLVVGTFFLVQGVTGVVTGSLALLSDAGHMATDVGGIGMALAAISLAARGGTRDGRTFGLYRLEILAALANAALLFFIAGWVLYEAVRRLTGTEHEIATGPVLVVATVGLVANLVAFVLLRQGASESVNVEGAYLEVLADTIGSVGVIVGAVVIAITGWDWVDPVLGAGIGLWILPRTWRLARRAVRILVQAAPDRLDLDAVTRDLAAIDGVVDVHDLHVWTLTSDMEVASAHLMVRVGTDNHAVLDQARDLLQERYGLSHATLQVEPDDHAGCDHLSW